MSSCLRPIPRPTSVPALPDDDYFGKWDGTSNVEYDPVVNISATEFDYEDEDVDGYTIAVTAWESIENTDPANNTDYPAGYRLVGTLEHRSWYQVWLADESGHTETLGEEVVVYVYLAADGESLMVSKWYGSRPRCELGPFASYP